MKKFLIILITLAMCTAAFALAGCEDEKDTDSGNQTEQGGGTEDGNQTEQGGGTEDGDSTNSGIVTQAEWEAAFDAKNFANYTMCTTQTMEDAKTSMLAKIAGNAAFIVFTDKNECYYEQTADALYEYSPAADGSWEKHETDYDAFSLHASIASLWKDAFGELTYSEEAKAYTADEMTIDGMAFESVMLKFSDKKIAHIRFTTYSYSASQDSPEPQPENKFTVDMRYYDYGTTQVYLPIDPWESIPDTDPDDISSDRVSESEWENALAESSFANYSVYASMQLEDLSGESAAVLATGEFLFLYDADSDPWRIYLNSPGGDIEGYGELSDGTFTQYLISDGVWTASELDESDFPSCDLNQYFHLLRGQYSNFTYSSEEKAYIAQDITIENGDVPYYFDLIRVKFTNGRLALLTLQTENGDARQTEEYLYYGYGETYIVLPYVAPSEEGGQPAPGEEEGVTDPEPDEEGGIEPSPGEEEGVTDPEPDEEGGIEPTPNEEEALER